MIFSRFIVLNKKVIETNILIIANNAAGLYAFRKELLEELLQSHKVYAATPKGVDVDNLIALGCTHIETNFNRHGTNPLFDLVLLKKYLSIIDRVEPKVVLTYTIKPNIYGGLACRIRKIPYITNITGLGVSLENKGPLGYIVRLLYRTGLKGSSMVFFQNEANQQFMLQNKIVHGQSYLLPGSGINLEMYPYEPYPEEKSKFVFLVIGRIMKDKGIDEILEATRIIRTKYKDVTFKLIGSFDGDYKNIINDAQKEDLIEYVGYIDNVHDYLKDSHATINASYHEGMSNVVLETAATGRPVLASNIPGCKEAVIDGESGILFNVKDVNALVNAIESFIALPYEKKVDMGIAGRKLMEAKFDRKQVVAKYTEVIKAVTKKQ